MPRHSNEPPPVAYSYIRFSSPEQAKGDSLRRQTAKTAEWCTRNGITLDTSVTLRDLGVSAYRGRHRRDDKFALGQFLKLAERGRIPKGSFLVIENLDRLSREDERKALRLWMDILDAGISIVQLVPETVFRYDKTDMMDIMRAIIELSRGHSESRIKSERSLDNWAERKQRARDEGETLTHSLPGWIEERNGKRIVPPAHKTTIKRIAQLAARGYGSTRIVSKLKEEGRPTFGKSGRWTVAYIIQLQNDRRLLGEFQPRSRATGEPDGQLIPDYYPAVLTETEFYAMQRSAKTRRCVRKEVSPVRLESVAELHQKGKSVLEIGRLLNASRQQVYRALIKLGIREAPSEVKPRGIYLFGGMVHTVFDRRPYWITSESGAGHAIKILRLAGKAQSFPYRVFERAILHELREINPKEILDGANGHDEVNSLEVEYGATEVEIQQMNADMDANGFSPTIAKRVRAAETRLADIARRLEVARQKATNPLSASWGEAKTLLSTLDSAPDQEDARIRLRSVLRRVIVGIKMQVLTKGRERIAFVIIEFTGEHQNRFRFYTVWYRPNIGNRREIRPGGWAVASAAGEGPPLILDPSDEPGEGMKVAFVSDWIQSLPAEPKAWHPLPE